MANDQDSNQGPKLGSRHRWLLRMERFSRRHYRLVFVATVIMLVAGVWFGSRLELESNILELIPEGNRQVDTLRESLTDFGSIDYLLVLLEAGEGAGTQELGDFAEVFAERLGQLDSLVEDVDYRFELDGPFLELFYSNAVLFLERDQLDELTARLSTEAIERSVQDNRLTMSTPMAPFASELVRADPLGLMPILLDKLAANRGGLQVDLSEGYYLSPDGKGLILRVKPTGPSHDLAFDRKLIEAVRQAEADTFAEFAEEFEEGEPNPYAQIEAHYSGNYALAVDESALIRSDVKFNVFFSLFAVSVLYFICYRRVAALLYSSLPLLVGQALTFGLAFLVLQSLFGRGLNAASSAFSALLMGLGTDFVIVIYARYVEERRKGASISEATERMIGETGLGVFTGAITSAGTFFAMCTSQFRGLFDLGFLIGGGILLCAVAILFLVPAMITWNEGVRLKGKDRVHRLHLQSFFLEHLITFSARNRVLMISVVLGLTAVSGWLALNLEFDDTIRALRSERSAAFQTQERIRDRFGAALSYMLAVAEAPDRDQALEMARGVHERMQPWLEDGTVTSFDSILTYVPPPNQQQEILDTLQTAGAALDADRIRTDFLASLDRNGFRAEPFAEFLERVPGFLGPQRPVRIADLEERGLGYLLDRYIAEQPGRVRVVTYMYLADERWKREPPPGFSASISGGDSDIVVTGTNVVNREFRMTFQREAPRAVAIGMVVVFVLLWIDFRSLRLTAIALSQLVCGVIMMLGVMRLLDIQLNYVNAFVATMILGVGIDYSIHLVHRLTMNGGRLDPGLLETGKAVVIASLTNIAGFGTLAMGNYPALRSFGIVALIGSLTCLFTALTWVPAVMARTDRSEAP